MFFILAGLTGDFFKSVNVTFILFPENISAHLFPFSVPDQKKAGPHCANTAISGLEVQDDKIRS